MALPSASAKSSSPIVTAVFWMSGALVSFTLMAIAVRELAGEIHTFEIMFFRSASALIFLAPCALAAGRTVWKTARTGLAHRP